MQIAVCTIQAVNRRSAPVLAIHLQHCNEGSYLQEDGSISALHAQEHMPPQRRILCLELLPALLGWNADQKLGGQVRRIPA